MTNIKVIDDKGHDKFLKMYLTERHSLRSALKHDLHLKLKMPINRTGNFYATGHSLIGYLEVTRLFPTRIL